MQKKGLVRKINNAILQSAENKAIRSKGFFCRGWLHDIPEPSKLKHHNSAK